MQRRAVVGELLLLGRRASRSRSRAAARPRPACRRRPRRPRPARAASPAARRRARPRPARGCSRSGSATSITTISVSSPNEPPKPRRKSIGTPITSATSAPFSPRRRAREKNSSWSAGTQPRARPLRKTGMPQRLGELAQRLLAVAPVEVRAGHDHRALGVAQQRDGALDLIAVGAGAVPRLGSTTSDSGSSASMKTRSSGKSTNVGPECGGSDCDQRLVDEAGDLGGALGRGGELHQRAHERDVVDLLQRALAPAHRGRAAAEHEDRRVVLLRGGDRAHPVGHARAGGERRDARRRA